MSWRATPRRVGRIQGIGRDISAIRWFIAELYRKTNRMEEHMADVHEVMGRIQAASENIAGDLRSVKARLDEAIADQDAAVQAALSGVGDELIPLAERLEAVAAETPEEPPAETPVEEPPADEPAVPGDGPAIP